MSRFYLELEVDLAQPAWPEHVVRGLLATVHSVLVAEETEGHVIQPKYTKSDGKIVVHNNQIGTWGIE